MIQSKPGRNLPTTEILLKCFLTQQSGAISSKTTLKDSAQLSLFSFMWHVQVFCLVWDDTCNNMRWRDWYRYWKMVPHNETSRQTLVTPRVWCPGPGTDTWQLMIISDAYQGRLRWTTARQERYIRQMAVRRRHSTARTLQMDFLQTSGQRISDQTVSNRHKWERPLQQTTSTWSHSHPGTL